MTKDKKLIVQQKVKELGKAGVYIFYRDEQPYTLARQRIGFSRGFMVMRINRLIVISNFWNFFSFFVVPQPTHVDEVEGILIASMPTANSAVPRIERVPFPPDISDILRSARRREIMGK